MRKPASARPTGSLYLRDRGEGQPYAAAFVWSAGSILGTNLGRASMRTT
jgi:hypothetical protein